MNPYALAILVTTRRLWFGRARSSGCALPLPSTSHGFRVGASAPIGSPSVRRVSPAAR